MRRKFSTHFAGDRTSVDRWTSTYVAFRDMEITHVTRPVRPVAGRGRAKESFGEVLGFEPVVDIGEGLTPAVS
jgi:hypothetical protein